MERIIDYVKRYYPFFLTLRLRQSLISHPTAVLPIMKYSVSLTIIAGCDVLIKGIENFNFFDILAVYQNPGACSIASFHVLRLSTVWVKSEIAAL